MIKTTKEASPFVHSSKASSGCQNKFLTKEEEEAGMNLWGLFYMFVFVPCSLFFSTIAVNILEKRVEREEKKKQNSGQIQEEHRMRYNY